MAYRFLPKRRSGNRPGVYIVDLIEDEPFIEDTVPDDVQVSHDGKGNVTVVAPDWTVSEDENGDVHITGNKISIVDDDIGGIEMKTLTINGMKFEVAGLPAPESATVGEYIQVSEVDANGKVTATEAVQSEATAVTEITLLASNWMTGSNWYYQTVHIEGITKYSKVDLNPSIEQLAIFHDKDLTFVTENEDGVVTVYALGDKPTNDYTIQATIKEVRA